MLSILIPCYNFDVRPLVHHLHQQLLQLSVSIEIRCVEDASDPEYVALNRSLQQLSSVHYEVLPQNLGRAKIRNYLAASAQYPYLLFMDCDSMPETEHYLTQYLQHLHPTTILYGGRTYAAAPPEDARLYFHWYYGSQREVQPSTQRQLRPYHAFMTNNFLVHKSIFSDILFDEKITQYGHEDTLFGLELQQRSIPVLHLDNPLRHIGLEKRQHFLHKSNLAVQNLYRLYQAGKLDDQATKLLRWYHRLRPVRGVLHLCGFLLRPFLWAYLNRNKRPILTLFDAYKLLYLIQQNTKQTR